DGAARLVPRGVVLVLVRVEDHDTLGQELAVELDLTDDGDERLPTGSAAAGSEGQHAGQDAEGGGAVRRLPGSTCHAFSLGASASCRPELAGSTCRLAGLFNWLLIPGAGDGLAAVARPESPISCESHAVADEAHRAVGHAELQA